MSNTPSDDYWKDQGRYGGNRPDNFSSDTAQDKYNEGKSQRDLDRTVDEALKNLSNPSDKKY